MPVLPNHYSDCIPPFKEDHLVYQGWVILIKSKKTDKVDCIVFDDLEAAKRYISRLNEGKLFVVTKPMAVTYSMELKYGIDK